MRIEPCRDLLMDEKAGNHEEDVDAEKSAADRIKSGMKQDDAENRDGAKPVDVGAIVTRASRGVRD